MTKPVLKQLLNSGGIPPFPITGVWDTVADVPPNAVLLDGGVLKQKLQYFNNEGTDYVDAGRPAIIVNNIRPQVDEFTVCCNLKTTSTAGAYVFGLGEGSSAAVRQLGVRINNAVNDKVLVLSIGGTFAVSSAQGDILNGSWHELILKVSTTTAKLYYDGAEVISAVVGSYVSTKNLMIGTLESSAPSTFNFEGGTAIVSFYSGVGDIDSPGKVGLTRLDRYNFTKSALWDGGAAGVSEAGNAFTVTDGVPTPALQFDLIPVSMKC